MSSLSKTEITSYLLAGIGLLAVLPLGLLSALLGGLLVFQLTVDGAHAFSKKGISPTFVKVIILALIALFFALLIGFGVASFKTNAMNGNENISALLQKMADAVDTARNRMPSWVQDYTPATFGEWQEATSDWLRENASSVSAVGRNVGVFFVHLIVGMVVGGLIAISQHNGPVKPLSTALTHRASFLSAAFRQVAFSQIRISALNTLLTALYLTVFLPMTGTHLPLTKTMIGITFVVGLLPIVGNLISNTIIVMISFGTSLQAAVEALVFLVVIHKLEYFVNARIIGSKINSRAWELLIAMLVMESTFGIPGLVAAPIYYAYLKNELAAKNLV